MVPCLDNFFVLVKTFRLYFEKCYTHWKAPPVKEKKRAAVLVLDMLLIYDFYKVNNDTCLITSSHYIYDSLLAKITS